MRFSARLPNGVRRLFRLPTSHARMLSEMEEEMRAHLDMRADELRANGMTDADAEAESLRRFGDSEEFRAYSERRVARQAPRRFMREWIAELVEDLRFAQRQFQRNLGFTALAVITLALGIGSNTAIFAVVHRLLIAPLPYADGDRIVRLAIEAPSGGRVSPDGAMLGVFRVRAHSLETIAGVSVDAMLTQTSEEQDTIPAYITANYLQLLRLRPALGRHFTAEEERTGSGVAMITHGLWQRRYGGRTSVLDSTIRVDGRSYSIIGVTPPEMGIPISSGRIVRGDLHEATPSIWLPRSLDAGFTSVFARLRPGVSADRASSELQRIVESIASESPGSPTAKRSCCARVIRPQDLLDARELRTVELLFVAVAALLLIACANAANLLLSRAWTRRREFAVRIALGAGRPRLIRQILTESLLLAVVGGLLGTAVAWLTLKVIIAMRPPALDFLADVHLQSTVLLWTTGLSLATGVLFGCAPALFAGVGFVGGVLRSETRGSSEGATARRLRSTLIVFEIAVSLALLTGAGLLFRSFIALQRVPLGFEPSGLVAVHTMLHAVPPRLSPAQRAALRESIVARVRAIPGVTDVALGMLPTTGFSVSGMTLETEPSADGQTRRTSDISFTFITPSYFGVTRIPLLEGRLPDSVAWLSAAERQNGLSRELVVNQGLARRLWPNGTAVAARLHSLPDQRGRIESYQVVGVVGDVQLPGTSAGVNAAQIYQLLPPKMEPTLLVRTARPATDVAAAIRHAIADVDPATIVYTLSVGEIAVSDALAPTRFAMALLGAFSIVALILSAVGLYGAITYSVGQRTREIGIRVALGAAPASVAQMVVGSGLRLAIVGSVVGIVVAGAGTRLLTNLLYDVQPADPLTFAAIAALVIAIALLASFLPARRALRIDPTEALRAD